LSRIGAGAEKMAFHLARKILPGTRVGQI
jgi:hypothetical protein